MNFLDEMILATLNEWQGSTLTAEQVALIIGVSDVNKVRTSLENLTEGHTPVIKTEGGYTIPHNKISTYIGGMALLTGLLFLPLFLV